MYSINNGYIITMKKEVYSRTTTKKSWRKKPDTVTTEIITSEYYNNYINSCKFFNNFSYGAYCKKYYGYTYAGYIPVSVVTVSPGKEVKIIAKFAFEIVR